MAKKPSYQDLKRRLIALEKEALKQKSPDKNLWLVYRAALQSSEGIAVSDLEGNLLFVNSAFAAMHGYTPQELQGKNLSIFHTREQMPAVNESKRQVREKGEFRGELWHWHRDRGEFPTLMHNSVLKDEQGNPIGMIGTVLDISDLKRAEQRNKLDEARLKALLELSQMQNVSLERIANFALNHAVELTDSKIGFLGFMNEDESVMTINAWSKTVMQKCSVQNRPTIYPIAGSGLWGDAIRQRKPVIVNDYSKLKTGKKGYPGGHLPITRFVGVPTFDGDRIVAMTAVANKADEYDAGDVRQLTLLMNGMWNYIRSSRMEEQRKKLESQLHQAKKLEAIGTLAGGIAHDFNNLLSVIMGNASLLLFNMDPNDETYEILEDIEQSAQEASSLTNRLLGYARKGRNEIRPISLNDLIREVSEVFGRTKKEIVIRHELAANLFAIEADVMQINQVLLNLYANAADAMREGGKLTVKTMNVKHEQTNDSISPAKAGSYILLSITDSGEGMDKETQEHIFDPFFTTKERGRGTGLGLTSVWSIVRDHGGYVEVDSKKGRGTTFSIYLPATTKKVKKSVDDRKKVTESSGTLLVVDDERKVLNMAAKVLSKLGYRVIEAAGGKEAVKIYRKNKGKIDLIILDMIMPEMGGREVYQKIKTINPQVKVLITSGYSIDDEVKQILQQNGARFVAKPFSMKDLYQAISKILNLGTAQKIPKLTG